MNLNQLFCRHRYYLKSWKPEDKGNFHKRRFIACCEKCGKKKLKVYEIGKGIKL